MRPKANHQHAHIHTRLTLRAGDVTGSQPWAVQLEARAKWDAWNSVKGMAKEEAQRLYVELLTKNDPTWESNPAAATFTE